MERKKYSAGAVKLSFWFMEFRKAVGILSSGGSFESVRKQSREENLFGAPTPARAKQICNTVITRIKSLDASFYQVFMESDLSTQKLFNLAAVMASDTLFFDFVYEVVREKLIIGSDELADSDIRVFFKNKQMQDEKVAAWTDYTLHRLGACYKTMLYEAGMIDKVSPTGRAGGLGRKSKDMRKILRPILDPAFEQWLISHDMEAVAKAFQGVR